MRTISVIAHPNSKKPRIETDILGVRHVYVAEPAREGKANKAIIQALANYLSIAPQRVRCMRGHTSKAKVFEVDKG